MAENVFAEPTIISKCNFGDLTANSNHVEWVTVGMAGIVGKDEYLTGSIAVREGEDAAALLGITSVTKPADFVPTSKLATGSIKIAGDDNGTETISLNLSNAIFMIPKGSNVANFYAATGSGTYLHENNKKTLIDFKKDGTTLRHGGFGVCSDSAR